MSIIRIGYSGSREGMITPQMRAVYEYLAYEITTHDWDDVQFEAHHGDCLGGDCQFDVIAAVLGCRRVAHPPLNSRLRAYCQADEIREPKDYLARDWDIAQETRELIATPKSPVPVRGSGTWRTIGYAVQIGRPATVFLRDGTWRPGSAFFGAPLPAVPGGAS